MILAHAVAEGNISTAADEMYKGQKSNNKMFKNITY